MPYKQVPDDWIIGYIPRSLAVRATVPPETLAPAIRVDPIAVMRVE